MNVTHYLNQADLGGAIFNNSGSAHVTNTILAGSLDRVGTSDSLNCDNDGASISSNGPNLASDNSCDLTSTGDQPATDPGFGPLQDNGGFTYTHDLFLDSTAIDAGTDTGCPDTDQRGSLALWEQPAISAWSNTASWCTIFICRLLRNRVTPRKHDH